jgi:hypothetical protein
MEVVNTAETSVTFYQTTLCNIAEDSCLQGQKPLFTAHLSYINDY